MKKLFTLLVLLICVQFAQSQNVKKYLMFEHFTNTRCSICASDNPDFFDRIEDNASSIHHIAFHPPIPYDNCELYLHNPVANQQRASFYSVFGTPRVLWNGINQSSVNAVTNPTIAERLTETSPLQITVSESLSFMRRATITIKTVGERPTGNLRLYAAVAEKELNYNAPNGETLHHNVYRRMVTDDINGESIIAPQTGDEVTLEYEYDIHPDWTIDEVYVLAWVQNMDTKEIINSGTRFDVISSVQNTLPAGAVFDISPNPSNGQTFLTLENLPLSNSNALIYNTLGQLVSELDIQTQTKRQAINIQHLETGTYIFKIRTEAGDFTKRIVKLK